MAYLSYGNVRIAGISACVPDKIVRNEDMHWLDFETRQQLIKGIGVSERRIADKDTTASDLCEAAAVKLINSLGWDKNEIELLIFCSQSPDYILPATSVVLQHKLGLSKNCMAFDINLGCSGYVYALSVACSLLNSGTIKKGILLCGDKSSISAPSQDKTTYPLFGDAGSATALNYEAGASPFLFQLNSNGAEHDSIIIPEGACRIPYNSNTLTYKEILPNVARNGISLILKGDRIFDFAINEVISSIRNMVQKTEISLEEIDYFMLHQANLLINETVRKLLKIPAQKVPYSLELYGNTSSASIPLTIVTQNGNIARNGVSKYLFCGFGVGFSWGTVILDMGNIICPSLIEYKTNNNHA